MSHYVVNETTEDMFEAVGDIQDAIRLAQDVARKGPAGDPVSILDSSGKAVRQFLRLPNGTVQEQAIARPKVSREDAQSGAVDSRPIAS